MRAFRYMAAIIVVAAMALTAAALAGPATAAPAAPSPVWPPPDFELPHFSPTMTWSNPPGATQYQIQVIPFNGDGPGVNLIRGLEDSYTIPPPLLGQGNYIMLPDMGYTWRVRVSDAPGSIDEQHPSWGPWSPERIFRTPKVTATGLTPTSPGNGTIVSTEGAVLQWQHESPYVFYFEVQVSPDPEFRTDAGAIAPVWWNLVHGGTSDPFNSWKTPPLESGKVYHWRVRPRIQGDGTPMAWSNARRFTALPPTPCCRVTVRVNTEVPRELTDLKITGTLTDMAGAPVSGVPMTATLRMPQRAWPTCSGGPTNSDGVSTCSVRVGTGATGQQVPVEVKFVYEGTTWTAITYVYPR